MTGFVDREGGSFYHEWSALFVMQGSQGDRIFFHYPRLQSLVGAEESATPLDSKHKSGLARILLKGQFLALPVTRSARRRTCALLSQFQARVIRTHLIFAWPLGNSATRTNRTQEKTR